MDYTPPVKRPPEMPTLFNALGTQYADEFKKIKQIMDRRNAQYEPPRPPEKKVFSSRPYEATL